MTGAGAVARLVEERGEEVARLWRARHLAAVVLDSDRDAIGRVHARGAALVEALGRALSGASPDDWGDFSHRETVQIATMMSWALAEEGATPGAVGALVPALSAALEEAGAGPVAEVLLPLGAVAVEGYVAARLAAAARAEQRRMVSTTPVLALPAATVLVAATGRPDGETAARIADRATDLALGLERPTVIVDLSHLESTAPAVIAALLSLGADVGRLEGRCLVTGLGPELREAAEAAGLDLASLETRETLAEALGDALGWKRWLGRLRDRLR